jgi:lipopolysaccharide export system permease protein
MLFHSSIRQELARSFVATLVVLITVVMSMMLIRTLGLASRGSVNPRDVIMLMGYSVLGNLATIMTLSLFIAVTNTLGRMYRESEVVVWFASGKGLTGFIRPVLHFAWPVLLAIAVLALLVWPWAAAQTNALKTQYAQRGDIDRLAVGQFQENASGSRVVFIEALDSDGAQPHGLRTVQPSSSTASQAPLSHTQSRHVFVSEVNGNKKTMTSARSGKIETVKSDQWVVLYNGQRTEQHLEKQQVTVMSFEEYAVVAHSSRLDSVNPPSAKSLPTQQLMAQPTPQHLAELSWRTGLIFAAFNLLFLAILVSAVNPRAGRSFGVAFALLAFVVYYNLLNVGFSRISTGRAEFLSWMLGLHGGVMALMMLWMTVRHQQWSWRNLLPLRRPRSQPA